MYINQSEFNIGNNNQITQFGEYSQHQNFESCAIFTPTETIPTVPVWSNDQFPMTTVDESPFLFCQPSQQDTIKHDQFTSSLQLVAESLMSSSDDHSISSEKYGQFHLSSGKYGDFLSDNKSFCDHFPQDHKKVMRSDDASPSQKSLEISFQTTQPDKQSSSCGVPLATSSNSDSRRTTTGKRRIRWTKDLHELFIVIVNHLGGPEKAKPKAILEMMGSDVLTISNVKSHLQKCRSALHMHPALKGRLNERQRRRDEISELQLKIQMQIEESGQLQLEIQKSNQQQMEVQQNLQLLIEQQKKQLKLMLDQQKQM